MPEGFFLGRAWASIELNADSVAEGMASAKKSISGGLKGIGESMQSLGANMTLLGAPFLAFGAMAVKSFSDSQDALAQLDAALKSTSSHNGEFSTSTNMSADDLQKLSDKLDTATKHLSDMQTVYDSNTKHTIAQNLALQNQKDEVAALTAQMEAGNATTSTMINVTHMSRDALIDMSKALQGVTRFSDEAILSAESMLLTFTNIGKDVFPDATKATLDMAQALGTDAKSAAMQLGKALSSYSGVTALKRMGVQFSQSQLDILKSLFESNRAMDAQKIILKELATEFGGSAEAAGKTFAGQLDILRNRVDDVMEGIGEKLLPVVQRLIDGISDLVDWFSNLDPHMQDVIIGIGTFMAALAVVGPIIAAVGTAISAVGGILAGIGTVIGIILSPIGLLIAAGAAIVFIFKDQIGGALSVFFGYLEKGEGFFKSLAAGIMALFGSNEITQGIANFLLQVDDFFNHFQDKIKLYGSLIQLYFEYYVTNRLSDFWNQKLKPAFDTFVAWFQTDGLPLIQGAMQSFQDDIWNPIVGVIGGIWEAVKIGLGLFADWWSAPGGGLAGIQTAIQTIKEKWIEPFILTLQNAWTNIKPGLESIANWFRDQFQHIGEWYIDPVLKFIARITTDVDAAIKKLKELLNIKDEAEKPQTSSGSYQVPANMIQPNVQPTPFGIGDAVNLAMAGFLGSIGGLPGAGLNNLNANLATVPIPPVYGGSSRPLPQRAEGGSVFAGMRYITGERGTETFTPSTNGTITPNGGDAGSGLTLTGDIYINASTEAGGRAAAKGFKEELESMYRGRGNS